MRARLRLFAFAVAVAVVAGGVSSTTAYAAPQVLQGTTVDVIVQPSNQPLLGSTAYVPVGVATLIPTLDAPLAFDVEVTVVMGGSAVGSCTLFAANTTCGISSVDVPAGPQATTVQFVGNATTTEYSGTLFGVIQTPPSFAIEWRDATGKWINGSGIGLPLFGDTAFRCVITNQSNAAITLTSVTYSVASLAPAPLTGSIPANETRAFEVWSGAASEASSGICSGGVLFSTGIDSSNGTGGGVIAIGGGISLVGALAPGATVTVVGDAIFPPIISSFRVLFDGTEVSGSPVSISEPDYGFSLDVSVPMGLEPGLYTLTVVGTSGDSDIAFAAFSFEVAEPEPELALTGPADAPLALVALGLLGAGALLLAASRVAVTRRAR